MPTETEKVLHLSLDEVLAIHAALVERFETKVFESKKLKPNLDWPAARLYHYLGLPVELYTPIFVLSRVVGWAAHVIEERADGRLIRPRSLYKGSPQRDWLAIEDR